MTNKDRALKSKSFCAALWTAIYQDPNGDVAPCCVWKEDNILKKFGNVNNSSLTEIYSSPKVLQLKEKMLSNETLSECVYCNKMQNSTGKSSRDFFNENFLNKIDWENNNTNFLHWDLRLSNLCNFKCRMCFHDLSSEWFDDAVKLSNKITHIKKPTQKIIKINDKSKFWNELEEHYQYVESIYFAGGEPFINEHHYKILQDLIDKNLNKNVKLIVNTNLSIIEFKKKKVLDYYKHFNHILFGFSIDGSYEVGEYIRKGLDYRQWKLNVKEFVDFINKKNSMDITYFFQFAYGVTNIHTICDFILDLHADNLLLNDKCKFSFQPIMNPQEQSVQSLPPQIFEKIKKDFDNLYITLNSFGYTEHFIEPLEHQFNNIILYINDTPFDKVFLNKFYQNQIELDKIRGESIFDILPDYRKLLITNNGTNLI